MIKMKKLFLILAIATTMVGCTKDFENEILPPAPSSLAIKSSVGIKLETAFVTSEVAMNVKSDLAQAVTIKIFDISNKVVSKEIVNVKVGDNILKVYTSALPNSAYRIGLYDSKGAELGITDFNKVN
jgi:hypothetical protein